MHLCHRGIHATKVGSFFVLLILWISCLLSLSALILHGSWCIHYHSTWAHYLQPYRMAISRDNAEIVAKEIQISLNLFERAEHVLKEVLLLKYSLLNWSPRQASKSGILRITQKHGFMSLKKSLLRSIFEVMTISQSRFQGTLKLSSRSRQIPET